VKLVSVPIRLVKETFAGFIDDHCMRMAAALSYYAIFSLPALLAITISVVAFFFHAENVRGQVGRQLINVIGERGAGQVEMLLAAANRPGQGWGGSIAGTCLLLVGATGVLVELQAALNEVWKIKPVRSGLTDFALKRLLSLLVLLAISGLLLLSLGMSAILAAFGDQVREWLPHWIGRWLLGWTHALANLAFIAILFAAMFKFLPDAVIDWRDVWLGAAVTTALFTLGNRLVGFYLTHSNPASAYGAAGPLAMILIWIYYAAMVVLLGAEFARAWAGWRGRRLGSNGPAGHTVSG